MADRKYPLHVFWGAGEPDCPEDLKAANGELIDMRCKVCGDGWLESHDVCMAALKTVPDAERLCRALRQFVKLVPAGDECRLQLTVGAQSFFIGIEPMPEDEAAHFAGLFVLALAGMVQQVTTGVKVPQVRLIGTACTSDPCEREQQCRKAGSCRRAVDSWASLPKDGEWPCEECGKPEKEHIGTGQQCPSGGKRFFPGDPDGVTRIDVGTFCTDTPTGERAKD